MYSTPLAVCAVEATRTFAVIGTGRPGGPRFALVQNDGQVPRDCDLGILWTNPLAQSLASCLERGPSLDACHQNVGGLVEQRS
jgi:hypothetical protein